MFLTDQPTGCYRDYHAVIDDLVSLSDNPFDDPDPQNFVSTSTFKNHLDGWHLTFDC